MRSAGPTADRATILVSALAEISGATTQSTGRTIR